MQFLHSISRSTVPKAFFRSINTPTAYILFYNAVIISSTKSRKVSAWTRLGLNILHLLRHKSNLLLYSFFRICENYGKKDIGLSFVKKTFVSLDLYSGIMLAILILFGKHQFENIHYIYDQMA